jgi:flavin reductase (DIM6/NTAB) family NADH-FMN oxidoreductase RutF
MIKFAEQNIIMNTETLFKISYGLYVVSSAAGGKRSGYISNTVFQVTAEPPQFAVVCSKDNYTAQLISESGKIGISVLKK